MFLAKANVVSVYILFFLYTHFANLFLFYNYPMKQPSMFHRNYLIRFEYNDKDTDDADDYDKINPVAYIIAIIQKQQAKKTATLPKNNISDLMEVIVYNFIKLSGVQANSAKRIVILLSNKTKYDPKILSNMSDLLQINCMEALAFMF